MYIFKTKLDVKNILKYKDNPVAKEFLKTIDAQCEKYRHKPIMAPTFETYLAYDTTGDRSAFEAAYFTNRTRLTSYFLRVALYGEEDDIRELNEIVWATCNEFNWSLPAHTPDMYKGNPISHNVVDLFASETAETLAEILGICGEYIHPYLRKRVVENIEWRVLRPVESLNKEKYRLWWLTGTNNWSAVCGGSVGIAALYIVEDEARLNRITDICTKTVNCYINSCTDDGVCLEGIDYWNYAMQYFVAYDELLKERLGKTAVLDEDKISKIAAFPSVACITDKLGIQFSDASGEPLTRCGTIMKLHERYGVALPNSWLLRTIQDDCSRTADAVRSLAWFNADYIDDTLKHEDVFKPIAEWCVKYVKDRILVVKGGHNDEPHNHNDIGSFMYLKNGVTVANDIGAPMYDRDFFTPDKRYTFINTSSQGHSVPIINGVLQHEGKEFAADEFKKIDGGAEISFAGAYTLDCGAKRVVRKATLDSDGKLTVKDSFEFEKGGNTVNDRVVSSYPIIIDGDRAIVKKDGETLATILPIGKVELSLDEDEFIAHESNIDNVVKKCKVYMLNVEYTTDGDTLECGYEIC